MGCVASPNAIKIFLLKLSLLIFFSIPSIWAADGIPGHFAILQSGRGANHRIFAVEVQETADAYGPVPRSQVMFSFSGSQLRQAAFIMGPIDPKTGARMPLIAGIDHNGTTSLFKPLSDGSVVTLSSTQSLQNARAIVEADENFAYVVSENNSIYKIENPIGFAISVEKVLNGSWFLGITNKPFGNIKSIRMVKQGMISVHTDQGCMYVVKLGSSPSQATLFTGIDVQSFATNWKNTARYHPAAIIDHLVFGSTAWMILDAYALPSSVIQSHGRTYYSAIQGIPYSRLAIRWDLTSQTPETWVNILDQQVEPAMMPSTQILNVDPQSNTLYIRRSVDRMAITAQGKKDVIRFAAYDPGRMIQGGAQQLPTAQMTIAGLIIDEPVKTWDWLPRAQASPLELAMQKILNLVARENESLVNQGYLPLSQSPSVRSFYQ